MSEQVFTDSALSEVTKSFLNQFKEADGTYKYMDAIDMMMPKSSRHVIIDYNDLYDTPEIQTIFTENPDRMFDAFARAIMEILQIRFPEYAESIQDEIRARLINFPSEKSLREITASTVGKIISVSGMVVRASEVKPFAEEMVFTCGNGHLSLIHI